MGKDSSNSRSKFGGGSKPNDSRGPAQIPARSRLSPLALQTHQKDKSMDRSQGTSADTAVAVDDSDDEEPQPSASVRRRNDPNAERGMGSRTLNGSGKIAKGQEKGKGRHYDEDLDQDFDEAVGDESRDELDLLHPHYSNSLPSFQKKASAMKPKNGSKVEVETVDIEEGRRGGSKKKQQVSHYSFFWRSDRRRKSSHTDNSFLSLLLSVFDPF